MIGREAPPFRYALSSQRPLAVRAGDLIFVGGLLPLLPSGELAATDVPGQTEAVLDALEQVLASLGASISDVMKHNVYFACEPDEKVIASFIEELDGVRVRRFPSPGPTTTEIRCGLDREGALLQMDAWAIVGAARERLEPPGHWSWSKPLPFVQGWKVGEMIFVGGQRSLNSRGEVLGAGDIEVQTDHAFRNLDTMLIAGGGDRNSLMRQNTYFRFFGQGRDVTSHWEKMTAVRRRYMSVPSAAGAGLRISGFPHTAELLQVEGIGVLGETKQRLQPADHWDWSIPNSQFTQGWKIGDLAFIGGQISADDKAKAVGVGDLAAQTRNVFNFVRATLAEGGLDESHVAKLYIYYCAEDDWSEIAEATATIAAIQREFYPDPGPAVTSVRVSGFAFEDLLIEIEAIAVVPR